MKIIILEGSPKRKGSSNMLAEQFAKGAKEAGHTIEVIEAAHGDIHPCTGCIHCGYEGPCIQKDDMEEIRKKIMSMFTDPNHLRVEDPGRVEGNPVFIYLDAFCKPEYFADFLPEYQNLDELKAHYTRGGLGDVKVKKFLNKVLQAELSPIRERRKYWEQHLDDVYDILKEGSKVAEAKAAQTLHDVRSAMQINYFDDNSLIK